MSTMNNIYEPLKKGLCLVTAGNIKDFNTMTIGWGTIGCLWSKPVFIAYVKPIRYTYEFMEKNDFFTISFYDEKYRKEMGYLGSKSGRDTDKVNDVKFNPVEIKEYNTVSFKEAKHTIVCKKIYFDDFNDSVLESIKDRYYKDEPYHRFYIGEIVSEIENYG